MRSLNALRSDDRVDVTIRFNDGRTWEQKNVALRFGQHSGWEVMGDDFCTCFPTQVVEQILWRWPETSGY